MNEHKSNKPEPIPFHTVSQLAKRWNCSEKKVRREIKSGNLVAHKFGSQIRISEADLTAYERANRRAI